MTFESFWPLAFLAAVPVIIILYLLKPKGITHMISSNLLWQKIIKNEQSRTFFEKFVHNILMYLQILIIALLVIALMSPFIQKEGKKGDRKVLLMDTSASMQHLSENGKSRLEEAVLQAVSYVKTEENTKFSIVACDGASAELLALDLSDRNEIVQTLQSLSASDCGGELTMAQGLLDNLLGTGEQTDHQETTVQQSVKLVVFTDGSGAEAFDGLEHYEQKELYVVGNKVQNVANEYMVSAIREDGHYDVMLSLVNYGEGAATLDVGLYDDKENLVNLKSMEIPAGEAAICLFEDVDWQGESLCGKITGVLFEDGKKDSLPGDNVSYCVKDKGGLIHGLLVGDGNTFLEKAYQAVTGEEITKTSADAEISEEYNVVIYDAGETPKTAANQLVFGNPGDKALGTVEKAMLQIRDCDLFAGLSDFAVGVNQAYYFEVPEGAQSFLEYDGKCIGYYGERDDYKEIVVGFDIRESDFPLRAEFPVFLANAMTYLADSSLLPTNVYYAGNEIVPQPWAELDMSQFDSCPQKAGLYQIGDDGQTEYYVVRFKSSGESDGRQEAESVVENGEYRMEKVRKALRNFFLIIVLILLVAEWLIYVRQMRYKGFFYPAVRGLVMLFVLLALLGVQLRLGSRNAVTVFVVDLSNSNEGQLSSMESYLSRQVDKMPSGNQYGIVTFGKDALVEQFVTKEHNFGGIMTMPEKSATNFEEAVSRAMTLIPGDANGRIVVLTDGKETRGNIQNMAQALRAGKIEYLTCLYEKESGKDAYIEKVDMPTYLHPGDKYSVTVKVSSNYETDAVIEIYRGSVQTSSANVHLNRGSNRFVFSEILDQNADSNAMESLNIKVQAPGDTCSENDTYSAYSVVEAAPKILVISGEGTNASSFTGVLNAFQCDYQVVSVYNAPDRIDDMLEYKAIVLVNVYSADLPQGFLDSLESYVKDYGCGFVCCGGEDSYALGGYRGTALETVLPVDMQLKSVNEKQNMAMVMVIDHSGSMLDTSMGISNLDVAIRAATVAVDNLNDSDQVGVLTFDDQYEWQVELTKASDRENIKKQIEQISEGGGTTIKPALEEAFNAISQSDASMKHVVLLTDGMGETTDFSDVMKAYKTAGVTLSTVAVGAGSDTRLLETLAKACGGRYYYSDVSKDIPKIFAQEVFLGGDSYIQNGQFQLAVRSSHEVTANLFPEGWPLLYGYIASSEKSTATVLISEPIKDAPILSIWQYGLGRSVAWNSDVTGEWSGNFVGQTDYVQLWKRIIDYAAGNVNLSGDKVNVVNTGEVTRIIYEAKDYQAKTESYAMVMGPDGKAEEVKLHATAPGIFEAEVATPQTGLYHFNVRRMEDGQIQNYMITASAVQFSDEYKFDVSAAPYLEFVNRYGEVIEEKDNIWDRVLTGAVRKKSLVNLFLALAILFFLADVAMRRFQYEPDWTKVARIRARQKEVLQEKREETAGKVSGAEAPDREVSEPAGRNPGDGADKMVKEKKTKKKKAAKAAAEETLDTSNLSKKKDGRNI